MKGVRLFAMGALAASVGGCANNDQSLLILRNQVPDDGCLVQASEMGVTHPSGMLDVSLGETYIFTPVVRSGALEGNEPNQRVIIVQGADVEIVAANTQSSIALVAALRAAADPSLIERRHRFSATVDPGALQALIFPILDPDQIAFIRSDPNFASGDVEIVARVTVFGEIDSSGIRSPAFDYPVRLCVGCLVEDLGACSMVPLGAMPDQGGACYPFQDYPVDCCDGDVCPAPVPTM